MEIKRIDTEASFKLYFFFTPNLAFVVEFHFKSMLCSALSQFKYRFIFKIKD